jgi:hypothetical protein
MSRRIEALVDHQIRRWDFARRSSVSEPPLPCVALSRPLGSGATEFGRRVLRALVVAPRPERVEQLRKRQSISAADAEEMVRQADASRREFLRYHFHREPDDPADYDLCVNTASLTLGAAARLVVAAYHERFPQSKR